MRVPALFGEVLPDQGVRCNLCPLLCCIPEGKNGVCRFRSNHGGKLYLENYGEIVDIAIEPIEKKPLYHYYPGSKTVSIGTNGCNMSCSFCQNYQISQETYPVKTLTHDELLRKLPGTIGVTYTFNEPLVWYEYVEDTCKVVRGAGYKNILNTNGLINPGPLQRILPYIDAINLDLKGFSDTFYQKVCGSPLRPILDTALALKADGVFFEISHLIIPLSNDHETQPLGRWILENLGDCIPIHLNAYYPRYKMAHDATTGEMLLRHKKDYLSMGHKYVYTGNSLVEGNETRCKNCGTILITRKGNKIDLLTEGGRCKFCGTYNHIVQ